MIRLGFCSIVSRLGIIRTGCSGSIGTITDYDLLSIIILRLGRIRIALSDASMPRLKDLLDIDLIF